ncbi:hypothetical protein ASG32_31625 [Methylobacterium sp. Leaf361]|uniref:COG3904 family protein n=1 Tax=Methylobacterium sp. Leaf361 TaxID=1736352 RepID=UPI0006FCE57A|nr:hypothetical protein [Methylobacterium sp. Leaf361]KQS57779.1 hypothetical protein ASG32_31625 [Methylobacterium sp. Leaf361]
MRFEAVQVSMMMIHIQATGTIMEDTPAEFDRFLKSDGATYSKDLHLHSLGGNLMAALRLGEMIRKAGMNTIIGRSIPLEGITNVYSYDSATCASACAYAFLGGVTRDYGDQDFYGLHRFGKNGKAISGDDAQVISGIISGYVQRMGVDQAVLSAAASAPFENGIYRLPVALAKRMRVVTGVSGETTFNVEDLDGRAVIRFEFNKRERRYAGSLSCVGGSKLLTVMDLDDAVPQSLRQARDFPVTFIDGAGRTLAGQVSYYKNPKLSYLLFSVPDLTTQSLAGNGLKLDDIQNPVLNRAVKGKSGATPEMIALMNWVGDVQQFAFQVAPTNALKTVPLVLRDCGSRR